ncbi:MAG: hypothetical protein IPL28_25215 [Chloroflexi bacterium]|nr:hypothetical protein [Chloroflexota bacterium]
MTTNGVVVQADSVRVDFKATPTGDVLATTTAVYNPSGTQRLSMAGDWSFTMPLAAYDPDTMGTGKYAFGFAAFPSVTNYPLFAGRIEEGDDDLNPDIHTVTISGMDMLGELTKKEIAHAEIWAIATEIPVSVLGERWYAYENETVIPKPEANDGDTGTEAGFILIRSLTIPRPQQPPTFPEEAAAEEDRLIQHVKFIYFGHSAPFWRIDLNIATDIVQSVASTIFIELFNAEGQWESRAIDTNTTIVAGKPFAQSGYIEWAKAELEHPIRHDGITQYWGRIGVSGAALSLFKIKETTVRTMGPLATDVETLVDDYAPAGWSLASGSETGTADGGRQIYIAGQTALAALVDLAKRTGEMFALIGTNQIKWLASPISSGITAKEAPEGGDTSTSVYISRLNRTRSRRDIITRAYLRGGGNDPVAQVTLSPLDGLDVSAYLGADYAVSGDWLINTALEATLATELPKTVNFPNIVAVGGGTGRNRQNALELLRFGRGLFGTQQRRGAALHGRYCWLALFLSASGHDHERRGQHL